MAGDRRVILPGMTRPARIAPIDRSVSIALAVAQTGESAPGPSWRARSLIPELDPPSHQPPTETLPS